MAEWKSGTLQVVIERLAACPMTSRVQVEAQFVTVLLGDAALDEEDMEWSHVLLRGRAFQIGLIPVSLVAVIPCQ